jgi:hypothetical protein
MDTAAFVIALIAFLAVGYWYFENEAKKAGGSTGLLALRLDGGEAEKTGEADGEAMAEESRYRARTRIAPMRADRLSKAPDAGTYRRKDADAPSYGKRARYGDATLEDL